MKDAALMIWRRGNPEFGYSDLTRPKNTPNGGDSKGNGTPKISGKSRLVKYYSIWPESMVVEMVPF